MKTLILIISILTISCQTHAQSFPGESLHKNEIKLNTIYLFGGYPEVSYERLLGNGSAVGVSVGVRLNPAKWNYVDDFLSYEYALLPYYRFYFGKKRAAGFFLEGNSIIFSRASKIDDQKELGMGLGIGLGAKFLIKNNWSLGLVAGGGFNLLQEPCDNSYVCFPDAYPRLELAIGKRF